MTSDEFRQMPDINTLIAAAWPNHIHHIQARRWLETETHSGWATCPTVQSGFLRISMNATVIGPATTFATALSLLQRYTSDPDHSFWDSEAPPFTWPQWLQQRVQGYRQITDATLLATALQSDGNIVTLDAGSLCRNRRRGYIENFARREVLRMICRGRGAKSSDSCSMLTATREPSRCIPPQCVGFLSVDTSSIFRPSPTNPE
jgi:uncharacterized protein